MAGPRFLRKTDMSGVVALRVDGQPVAELHARLARLLYEHDPRLAALFAEPVASWGNDIQPASISWYAAVPGELTALPKLDDAARVAATAKLSERLQLIEPLLHQPEHVPLLRAALILPSLDDVLAVGDEIVITNWGFAPTDIATRPDQLTAHFAATLGHIGGYDLPAPPASGAPFVAQTIVTPNAGAASATSTGPSATAPGIALRKWLLGSPIGIPLATIAIVLLVTIASAAAGYFFGWRALITELSARRYPVADPQMLTDFVKTQKDINAGLRRQIEAAQATLASPNICTIDNPLGLPPAPAATPINRTALPGSPAFQGSLADLLEKSVVLVLTETANGVDFGTGFVIAPQLIVTNLHVVEAAKLGRVFVTSHALGSIKPAEVVARTPNSNIFEPDFAVLKVPGAASLPPLTLSFSASRLDSVVAAGFPGVVMSSDDEFRKILRGEASDVPGAVLTGGEINTIQNDRRGARLIHTAAISGGNSGGPLTDRCGRVVGVNTFGKTDAGQLARVNFALSTSSLATFLKVNNVPHVAVQDACEPAAAGVATPPQTRGP